MFDFMKYRYLYFFISALVIVPGVFSLLKWGLKPAIDFTGGTVWEIQFSAISPATISGEIEAGKPSPITPNDLKTKVEVVGVEVVSIEQKPEEHFILRLRPIDQTKKNALGKALTETFGNFTEISYELVGPTLGRELLVKTVTGVLLATTVILFYIAWRFKKRMYGISATLATLHDTLVILGVFSLLGRFYGVEVDTLFVTAVLTILSFSVHDTIVTYDRIRESQTKNPDAKLYDLINKAVGETLTRSFNNSLTIIFMLLALFLLGGESIHWFVFALLVGTISGTYSSAFTAAPILVTWDLLSKSRKTKK